MLYSDSTSNSSYSCDISRESVQFAFFVHFTISDPFSGHLTNVRRLRRENIDFSKKRRIFIGKFWYVVNIAFFSCLVAPPGPRLAQPNDRLWMLPTVSRVVFHHSLLVFDQRNVWEDRNDQLIAKTVDQTCVVGQRSRVSLWVSLCIILQTSDLEILVFLDGREPFLAI